MAGPTRDLILGALGALGALAFFAAGMADASAAGSRGLTIRPRGAVLPSGPELRLYGDSRALVIGIDDYTHGWPRLKMAVADARAVARELERRGFDVTLKLNLDSADLSRTLKEFFAIQGAEPEARLFLWFAGHGQTIGGEGFLVPADAPLAADPAFKVKALHMRDFGGLVRLAEAKHVLSIFDSCFSGTIFRARAAAAPAAIGAKTAKPVRQFLTSGDAGQEVRDDGSFRELFLRAIRGEARADANTDGYVTGDELGLFLSQSMAGLTDAAQTPRWGRLQDVRFNQGDFVFEAGEGTVVAPPPPPPLGNSVEIAFWNSIKTSDDPADLEAYLEKFPGGVFAKLARNRLARLSPRAAPSPVVIETEATFVALQNVNLRASPSVEGGYLGTAQRDAGLVVTGRVTGRPWYRIRLPDGAPAFVHRDYVKPVDAAELIAWYRLKQSDDFQGHRRFVRRFPNGHFTKIARKRGRELFRATRNAEKRRHVETKRQRRADQARQRRERRLLNDLVRLFGRFAGQAGRQ